MFGANIHFKLSSNFSIYPTWHHVFWNGLILPHTFWHLSSTRCTHKHRTASRTVCLTFSLQQKHPEKVRFSYSSGFLKFYSSTNQTAFTFSKNYLRTKSDLLSKYRTTLKSKAIAFQSACLCTETERFHQRVCYEIN